MRAPTTIGPLLGAALAAAASLRSAPARGASTLSKDLAAGTQGTFIAIGNAVYSVTASSGISVTAGGVTAPFFAGSGAGITGVGGGPAILDRTTADATVANTTTETALYTFTVPGGTIGTDKELVLDAHLLASFFNAATLTIRVKYGATTLATLGETSGSTSANRTARLRVRLFGKSTTNFQMSGTVMNQFIAPTFLNSSSTFASEDSSTPLNLVVTAQWSVANAGNTITLRQASLTKY